MATLDMETDIMEDMDEGMEVTTDEDTGELSSWKEAEEVREKAVAVEVERDKNFSELRDHELVA